MWPKQSKCVFVVLHIIGCHLYLKYCSCFDFWVMSLLSSWDKMDVPDKLLADDVWAAEDDKTGFLNVGVGCFGRLHFQRRPISLTMM